MNILTSGRSASGLFRDHPVRRVPHQDPLMRLKDVNPGPSSKNGVSTDRARPRIGFACQWEQIPERTWSYTPWNLREELRSVAETTDIGFQISRLPQTALKAIHTRYHGRLTTTWSYSPLPEAYIGHVLRRELIRNPAARRCDAILMMQELAAGIPACARRRHKSSAPWQASQARQQDARITASRDYCNWGQDHGRE